ncbi:MAG: hypothetical protein JWP97_5383 [Labilithrix sp.]|nr:hypothetical protein [Labilithrix sp.]
MWQISRRGLLKAAGALGLSVSAAELSFGCSSDPDPSVPPGPRPIETVVFQFDLSTLPPDLADLRLEVGDRRYPIVRNDPASLADARERNPLLALVADAELTYYAADVALPADAPQSYTVSYAIEGSERRCLALAGIHVPRIGVSQAAALKGASFNYLAFRRKQLGVALVPSNRGGVHTLDCVAGEYSGDISDLSEFTDEYDAARFLVFHHNDIIALEKTVAAVVFHHLDCANGLQSLAEAISLAGETQPVGEGEGVTAWARGVYTLDPDGNRTQQEDEKGIKLVDAKGRPIYDWHYELDELVRDKLNAVVQEALSAIHDDADLERIRFHIPEARSTRAEPLPDGSPALLKGDANGAYAFSLETESWSAGQCVSNLRADASRNVRFEVANSYHRHLGVFCAYLDAAGNVLKRADVGAEAGEKYGGAINLDTDYLQFKGLLAPPPWLLLGLPVPPPFDISREDFAAKIPEKASKLAVLTATVAFSKGDSRLDNVFRDADLPGHIMTLVSEMAIPILALTYGALFTAGTWQTLQRSLVVPVLQLIGKVAASIASVSSGGSAHITGIAIWLGNTVLKLIATGVVASLTSAWAVGVAAGTSLRATPIMGTVFVALQALDTGLQIGFTIGALASGVRCRATTIASTNAVVVSLVPADRLGFPRTANAYEVSLTPNGGDALKMSGTFNSLATPNQVDVTFPKVPSGGDCAVAVRFYVKAQPNTSQVDIAVGGRDQTFLNLVASGASSVPVTIEVKNYPIEIKPGTTYSPTAKLTVDGDAHVFVKPAAGDSPPGGVALACEGASEMLCAPTSIALSASAAQVGYSWNAAEAALPLCGSSGGGGTSLFTMQNLNLDVTAAGGAGAPDANLKRYGCGVTSPVIPLYPLFGPAPPAAGAYTMFVLEAGTGRYVLRELNVGREEPQNGDFRAGRIVARLTSTVVRAAAINRASGSVMIVSGNAGVDTIEIVDLSQPRPGSDADAPTAALRGGSGELRGHLSEPVAVAAVIGADVFLVLENGNKRVQALSPTGEPVVDYFVAGTGTGVTKSAFLALADDLTYLDLSVDQASGKIFVLSRKGTIGAATDYRLDVYDPRTSLLVTTTTGFAAANLALDNNQNAFAIGWNTLTFRGRKEPGLWVWSPSVQPALGGP